MKIFLLSIVLFTVLTHVQGVTFNNKFNVSFSASEAQGVRVSNKYGQVVIEYNNLDSVVIKADITVALPSREDSASFFSNVKIEEFLSEELIVANTVINPDFQTTYDFSINYKISIPQSYRLDISNQFGDIYLPSYTQPLIIKLEYGKLFAKNILNNSKQHSIELNYAEAIIDTISNVDIKAETAIVTIKSGNSVAINSRYSKFTIANAISISGKSYFDNIIVDKCGSFTCDGEYSEFTIEVLKREIQSTMNYGSLKVNKVLDSFKNIALNNKYVTTNISFVPETSYILNADMQYCKIEIPQPNNISKVQEQFSKSLNGIIGTKPNPTATVSIVSRFGDAFLVKL